MVIDKNKVVKINNSQWCVEDDLVVVKNNGDKLIFNKTMSVVWLEIDGVSTVGQLINKLYASYKEQNTMEHLEAIVKESISQLLQDGIVDLIDGNLFAGWCEDEF